MSRTARVHSNSGYMHVMARGLTRQIIFEKTPDMDYFISSLRKACIKYEIKIISYCLMINHFHLLIYDKNKNVSKFMQSLCGQYTLYFNRKYDRLGTLFQRPFKSRPVEDDSYLLSVFRYIINNPVHDGISSAQTYKWNSYRYFSKKDEVFDSTIIKKMIGGIKALDYFLSEEDDTEFTDFEFADSKHLSDQYARKLLQKKFQIYTTTNIRQMSREKRNEAIRFLKFKGFSVRQIERLTGVSRGIIQHIL